MVSRDKNEVLTILWSSSDLSPAWHQLTKPEHDLINIVWLTKFRLFESNLDSLNALLLQFTLSLCWEMGWMDPLIPSLMTWVHKSQITRCCSVSASITKVSWTSPLLKENVTRVVTGYLEAGIYLLACSQCCEAAHQYSHILTTTQEAWFDEKLQCLPPAQTPSQPLRKIERHSMFYMRL
jgi:hypothetical protein